MGACHKVFQTLHHLTHMHTEEYINCKLTVSQWAGPLEYQVQRATSVHKLCKNRTQQTVYIGLFTLNSIKVKSPQKFQSEQARSSEGSAPCPVLSTIHS